MKNLTKMIFMTGAICGLLLLNGTDAKACSVSAAVHQQHYTEALTYGINYWAYPYDSSHVNLMVRWYEMDRGNWDNGYGWYSTRDFGRPFARTMNALTLIRKAPQSGWIVGEDITNFSAAARSQSTVHWLQNVKSYTTQAIDELDAECRNGGAAATTVYFIDHYTDLYMDFFFGFRIFHQAASIVHESLHAGMQLNARHEGRGCRARASCDLTWHKWNSTSLEATYLYALTRSGRTLSEEQRKAAKAESIATLQDFLTRPADASAWNWCVDNRYRSSFSSFRKCY